MPKKNPTASRKATPSKRAVKQPTASAKTTPAKTTPAKAARSKTKKPVKTALPLTKSDLVKKYRSHKSDTGSIEVQVALFSEKINQLSKHLRKHHKDNDSKRGLLQMIGKRRRLLNYLKKRSQKKYEKLILDLGLRK